MKNSMKRLLFFLALLSILVLTAYSDEFRVKVEPGDTLYGIARRYNVRVEDLVQLNTISDPGRLKVGQLLRIPFSYAVKRGDTLYGIAREHGTTINELRRLNNLSENHLLRIGEVIILPASAALKQEAQPSVTADAKTITPQEKPDESPPGAAGTSAASANGTGLLWPHSGPRTPLTGKLVGIKITGEAGDQVKSISSGNVVWVAPYRGFGNLVMVESADKYIYAYGGNDEIFVRLGDKVEAGTLLGRLGMNVMEKGAYVFFFVYRNGSPVNPVNAPRG